MLKNMEQSFQDLTPVKFITIFEKVLLRRIWEFFNENSIVQPSLSYFCFEQISQNFLFEIWMFYGEKQNNRQKAKKSISDFRINTSIFRFLFERRISATDDFEWNSNFF